MTFIHGSRDGGYILLDTIIALLILSISLTAVYGFYIRGFNYQNRLESTLDQSLEEGVNSDKELQKVIK